jgi:hypothetical protein
MKDLHARFKTWYRRTHWMAPTLNQRGNGEYEDGVVQAMFTAYRAGFNRSRKEGGERLRCTLRRD